MKKRIFLCFVVFLLLLGGCAAKQPFNAITQISTIDALLAGAYDGQTTCAKLKEYGDLGIGTFDRLDGEMILLDGRFYQVTSDGVVRRPDGRLTTPFATVCRFAPDKTLELAGPVNYAEFKERLDEEFPNQNVFYAIKITGVFKSVHTRSVPAQKKPYPPLAEVTAHQPEFRATNVIGAIVGFRCPPFVKGINVPGYHLHFLSEDKTFGGHIRDFEMETCRCEVDLCTRFRLFLPENPDTLQAMDLSRDRSEELKQVEQ